MKKQILIILILAIIAGSSVFGQTAVTGSAPRGVNCTNDALHPIAGREYTYQAVSGQTGNFTFWATKDPNFISTSGSTTITNMATSMLAIGSDLISATNYANPSLTDNVKITWSDAILAATTSSAPTFVAVNKDGSCANNFKVWAITPIKAFSVDIMNMDNSVTADGFDALETQCFDQVRGAIYNTTTKQMEYNYGANVMYFEVIAANFTGSWTPTFNITGLGNGQTAVLDWAYNKGFTSPVSNPITNNTPLTTSAATTAQTVTANGVSIFVRVTITNHTYEGTSPTPITLAVDGINSVNDWDIENNNAVTPGMLCLAGVLNDKLDVATQTLKPRPDVASGDPLNIPLVPGNETN